MFCFHSTLEPSSPSRLALFLRKEFSLLILQERRKKENTLCFRFQRISPQNTKSDKTALTLWLLRASSRCKGKQTCSFCTSIIVYYSHLRSRRCNGDQEMLLRDGAGRREGLWSPSERQENSELGNIQTFLSIECWGTTGSMINKNMYGDSGGHLNFLKFYYLNCYLFIFSQHNNSFINTI